ncbi:MAG: RNA-binding protein [Candidatus Bostrichicola ureolyticus]|nr:MAG: RNA-binding protein [Candidatus Bostrichicola ureolyticus]
MFKMKLYVGNLPYKTSEQEIKKYFESIGEVNSAKIITYKTRSKGFGFIEMSSYESAQKAIKQLNGTQFMGRNIVVSEAKPNKGTGVKKTNYMS